VSAKAVRGAAIAWRERRCALKRDALQQPLAAIAGCKVRRRRIE
jgi:hypothetical protein